MMAQSKKRQQEPAKTKGGNRGSIISASSAQQPDIEAELCWYSEGQQLRSLDNEGQTLEQTDSAQTRIRIHRWEVLVGNLTKSDNWSRLKRILKKLPEDICDIYSDIEGSSNIKFTERQKIKFYAEFKKATSCFKSSLAMDTLHSAEVEYLIRQLPDIQITDEPLRALVQSKLEQAGKCQKDRFDFRLFVSLLSDVLKYERSDSRMPCWWPAMMFRLPIDPDSDAKQYWDLFCLMLLLYCSFSVPYSIAFISAEEAPDGLIDSEILMDSLFLFDILLSFCTAYEEKGFIVRDMGKIAKNYLRTWFLPDLAGSFPFDRILTLVASQQPGFGSTNLFRVLRFVRMLKLFRALKLMNRLSRLKDKEGYEQFTSLIGILTASFLLMFVAHALGCFFTMLLDPSEPTDWLRHYRPELADAGDWVRYVTALYWAIITITTTGYGDVVPATPSERLFAIFVALVGAVVFSYCVGSISVLVSQYSTVDTRFQNHLRCVFEYLQFREISAKLKRQVRNYYAFSYRRHPELFEESEIMLELIEPLRLELLGDIGRKAVENLPVFQGVDPVCVGRIVTRMRIATFAPGQRIFKFGDFARDMFFIVSGSVRLSAPRSAQENRRSQSIASLPSVDKSDSINEHGEKGSRTIAHGDIFGEQAMFPEILQPIRLESAEALSWTITYSLSWQDIDILGEGLKKRLKELCHLKHIQLLARTEGHLKEYILEFGTRPSRLEFAVSQLKQDLLRTAEETVLLPAAGIDGSEVMRLLIPTKFEPSGESTNEGWRSISCILSESGSLLYIAHTLSDLELDQPKCLGMVVPGKSSFRTLSSDQIEAYGNFETKIPVGIEVMVYSSELVAVPLKISATEGNAQNENGQATQQAHPQDYGYWIPICTWFHHDFEELSETLKRWCAALPSGVSRTERGRSISADPAVNVVDIAWERQVPSELLLAPLKSERKASRSNIADSDSEYTVVRCRSPNRHIECDQLCLQKGSATVDGAVVKVDTVSIDASVESAWQHMNSSSEQWEHEQTLLTKKIQQLLQENEELETELRKLKCHDSAFHMASHRSDSFKGYEILHKLCDDTLASASMVSSQESICNAYNDSLINNLVPREQLNLVYTRIYKSLQDIEDFTSCSALAIRSLEHTKAKVI